MVIDIYSSINVLMTFCCLSLLNVCTPFLIMHVAPANFISFAFCHSVIFNQ